MPDDGRAVPDGPGRAGDLRRPRAHQGHLPAASPSSATWPSPPSCTPGRVTSRRSRTSARSSPRSSPRCPTRRSCPTSTPPWPGPRSRARATRRRLGITGFCWGGRIVWLYAAHNPDLKAGVAWYGRLVGQPDELASQEPDRPGRTAQSAGPRALRRRRPGDPGQHRSNRCAPRSKKAGKTAEIIVYPDTPHAFFADYRPSYRKDKAAGRLEAAAGVVQEKRRGLSTHQQVTSCVASKSGGCLATEAVPGHSPFYCARR